MRTRRPPSLSLRLVATYGLLVAATLLIVAAVAIQLTRSHLRGSLDDRLSDAVRSFERGWAGRVTSPDELESQARRWLAVQTVSDDGTAAVRIPGGRVLTSAGGADLEATPGGREVLESTSSRWWSLDGPDGTLRALSVPLELDGRQVGTLAVAASEARVDATIRALATRVLWAAAAGLLFAGFLGFAGVRRTLRPLATMASDVQAIEAAGSPALRVSEDGPEDEVGRLARSFNRMLRRLEESFRAQQRFVADASHELRTPLTVARGQLELLLGEIEGAQALGHASLALEELDRMRKIVEDLLLLARLDEGMELARESVEVELIVREALLRAMLIAPRKTAVDIEEGLTATADPDRLLQVLTNLLTNAVVHGGEDAHIEVRGHGRLDGVVEIIVGDDGPGIPQAELPQMFDRMARGVRARAGAPGGAGLGLAIAASLTEAMGGEISVASRPGEGTSFTVVLPAGFDPVADTPELSPAEAARRD